MIDGTQGDGPERILSTFYLLLIMIPSDLLAIYDNQSLFHFVIDFLSLLGQGRFEDTSWRSFAENVRDTLDNKSLLGLRWDLAGICQILRKAQGLS